MNSKILDVKPYEQTTFLTCLSACFMMARTFLGEDLPFNQKIELENYIKALKSRKDFYQFGFLEQAVEAKYQVNMIVEVPDLYEYLKRLNRKVNNQITLRFDYISIDLIKELLNKEKVPLIVLIDQWPISLYVRAQHYIIVFGYDNQNIHIIDPWYGQRIKMPYKKFQETIDSLRSNLLCGAQIIYLKE